MKKQQGGQQGLQSPKPSVFEEWYAIDQQILGYITPTKGTIQETPSQGHYVRCTTILGT